MPMDKDWKIWHQNPRKPKFRLPKGAVDAHCHIFGPEEKFPYAPERKYTPCTGSKEQLFALRDHLGLQRNVIVQASCHGLNNDALLDGLRTANDRARGVAVVDANISFDTLTRMDALGVRGVRFNFVKRLVDPKPLSYYQRIIDKIIPLGWHIVVYLEAAELAQNLPFLQDLPLNVVFDHMARPDVTQGINAPEFQAFMTAMEHQHFWAKVSCPERLTTQGNGHNNYSDVIPFMKTLVDLFADRVLWGTDWPHPNMKSHMPDDGQLVDLIPFIADTPQKQYKLLVQNPMRLYWGR